MHLQIIDTKQFSTSKALMDISKKDPKHFEISIDILSPIGEVLEVWAIEVAEISSIIFGNLSYINDSTLIHQMTIKPIKVELI